MSNRVEAEIPGVVWRKSSRSCDSANCVEVAALPGAVKVRDSKDPAGPVLTFSCGAWRRFVAAVRADAI